MYSKLIWPKQFINSEVSNGVDARKSTEYFLMTSKVIVDKNYDVIKDSSIKKIKTYGAILENSDIESFTLEDIATVLSSLKG